MKKLEVPDELEQVVGNVCDAFLKSAGLAAHGAVAAVREVFSKIKVLDEPEQPPAEQK